MGDGLVVGSAFPSFVGSSEVGGPVAASNGGFARYVLNRRAFHASLRLANSTLRRDMIGFFPFLDDPFQRPLDLVTGQRLYAWTNPSRSNPGLASRSRGVQPHNVTANNTQYEHPSLFSTPTSSSHGTVAMWLRVDQDDTTAVPLVIIGSSTDPSIFMGYLNGGYMIGAQSTTFGVLDLVSTNVKHSIGDWHHVAWVADDSGSPTWRIWVDGEEQVGLTVVLGSNHGYWAGILDQLGFGPLSFTLARQSEAPNNTKMSFSDIGIWNRVLTQGEITRLYRDPDSVYDYRVRRVNLDYFRRHVPSIDSAEALGTPTVQLQVSPTAIDTAQAFGTAKVQLQVSATGIASAEALGTAKVNLQVLPTGIPSAEALGAAQVSEQVRATGIASAEAFGTAKVQLQVSPSSIPSAEAFGTPQFNLQVLVSDIASAEAFGTATVAAQVLISPTSIPSAEAHGTPSVLLEIAPTSIGSAEAFGLPQVQLQILVSGIPSAEALGTASLLLEVDPSGIGSAEALGSLSVQLDILPSGIASAQAFGLPFFGNGVSGPVPNLDVLSPAAAIVLQLLGTSLALPLSLTGLTIEITEPDLPIGLPQVNLDLRLPGINLDLRVR